MFCQRLTARQLETLSQHKYTASGATLLDPLMQPWWRWLVEKVVPIWWAPNAMTLVGLCCNIFTALLLVYYSPDAKQPIPGWPLLLCAIGLFVYQTLDACDGKQARRTNTSSALGELFDHGCDAVSTIFVSLSVCLAVQLGEQATLMLVLCVMATALFYMAHWQTYVTGELRFAKFDVTEAQITIVLIQLISAICGTDFWTIKIADSFGLDLRVTVIIITGFNAITFSYRYFHSIIFEGVGKNGSSVACTSILSPSTQLVISVSMALTIYFKSSSNVFEDHICLYLITFGLVTAKLTCKLVIAQMSKSPIDKTDSIMLGPAILFFNQYFNTFIPEYFLLWTALVYIICDFLYYSYVICNQIADYQKIHILSIQYDRSLTKSQSSANSTSSSTMTTTSNDKSKPEFVSLLLESDLEEYNQELIH